MIPKTLALTLVVGALALGCSGPAPVVCGDGERGAGEECDDGNTRYDDGCSGTCDQERGWTCTVESVCSGVCGDDITVADEACDPSDSDWIDYCSVDCMMITGSCGDGTLQPREDCDDMNMLAGDGCQSCGAAYGFTCTAGACDASTADPTTTFGDASDPDLTAFCTWFIATLGGGGRMIDCDNGLRYTINTVTQCTAAIRGSATLGACTVQQFEAYVAEGGSACGVLSSSRNVC